MTRRRTQRPVLFTSLPEDWQKEISDAFTTFDSDKSGFIDRHELRAAFKALGCEITREEAVDILEANNATAKGLSRSQFLQISAERVSQQRSPENEINKSFALFDSDCDRKIDLKDLQKVCFATGIHFEEPILREMIATFADEGCDYITASQFREIINPTTSVFN